MNYQAIAGKLALMIDRTIQPGRIDESFPNTPETLAGHPDLSGLCSAVDEYLARPMPASIRTSALEVAAMSRGRLSGSDDVPFRSALEALRKALAVQGEEEAAASRIAGDPELVQEFLVEARAHLAGVESGLLLLEREPQNAEALNAVFRSFHTIKGLAAFLGAAAIEELAHETENVLDLARAGKLTLSREIIELILRSGDELNFCLDRAAGMPMNELPRCNVILLAALAESGCEKPAQVQARGVRLSDAALPAPPAAHKNNSESSVVRIETARLEHLIDMVGELVMAESMVRHDPAIAGSSDPLLSRNLAHLARVVQEVQKTSMSMRMVAVGSLFRKMGRLTRDLARKSGKQIELVTAGDDVELDRGVVQELADAMVHMVRNAVDHGLETPDDRRRAGKPETGAVRLRALHDAGDVVIEISDDGRGMDPARILARARRQGLVAECESPDEEAIFRLIFEAGFSTAEKVTDMSGRGVGMDVVRKQIEKVRGSMAIKSVPGQGCTFVMRLPSRFPPLNLWQPFAHRGTV